MLNFMQVADLLMLSWYLTLEKLMLPLMPTNTKPLIQQYSQMQGGLRMKLLSWWKEHSVRTQLTWKIYC